MTTAPAWSPGCTPSRRPRCGSPACSNLGKPLAHLHTQFGIATSPGNDRHGLHEPPPVRPRGPRVRPHLRAARLPRKVHRRPLGGSRSAREAGSMDARRGRSPWHDLRACKIARFGDNMREVAVTEGDKVSAQRPARHGRSTATVVGDPRRPCRSRDRCGDRPRSARPTRASYAVAPELGPTGERHGALRDAARIELGLRSLPRRGRLPRLHRPPSRTSTASSQLPGIAVQRLMADGYGFGAEGDWKTAALVRAMKVMSDGLAGGTSFMEDYTYHFEPGNESRPRRTHARDLPEHRRRQAEAGDPPALDRREVRSRSAAF
jgi:L-arabinose isomerase